MQDMKSWTEYISSLSDEKFFYIMRLYLGEIKTPFNKLRLIEQLAGFIRIKNNLDSIIILLDEVDVKFLTVVDMIPGVSQEVIRKFFEDEYSLSLIVTRLSNLQDRLLVYTEKKPYSDELLFKINPLVEAEIKPYLNPELIFPEPVLEHRYLETPFILTPNFLSAFISYVNISGCDLKADGKFRKSDLSNLEQIFGDKINCLQFLVNGLINLGLLHEGEKKLLVDEPRLFQFAENSELNQYIYIAVASVMRLSREGLKKQCQLLADSLASVPECGVTKRSFLRMAQFISGRPAGNDSGKVVSRFSEMLNRMKNESQENSLNDSTSIMDSVFDAVVEFGLLVLYGENEEGENIYVRGQIGNNDFLADQNQKVLNINASSSVTLLPGLSLKKLLPFTFFMQSIKCSTVTEYEITRKSVSNGFDKGYSLEKIKEILSCYASFELPQNLIFNLDEWYNAYSSVVLYKGFVLKVSKENISMIENNPAVSIHISEKLAEGIYLLDLPVEENPASFIKSWGLEFMGSVKTPEKKSEVFSLPHFSQGSVFSFAKTEKEYFSVSDEKVFEAEEKFMDKLKELKFDELQLESLQARIRNHLIISESQLVPSSVRSEIIRADGIDFYGKIHLIDAAIKNNDILELTLPNADGTEGEVVVQVQPLKIIKNEGEAILRFEVPPDKEQRSFSVSRILHIKRIRV